MIVGQGLKPHIFAAIFGPAEAVPLLQSAVCGGCGMSKLMP